MFSTFSNIYSFIIKANVILIGSLITSINLFTAYYFFNNPLSYVLFFIIGVVISIITGAHIFVILSIPFQLPPKFDVIKNNVALNKYESIQDLQSDIAKFMVSFFSFAGLDIVGGKFHFLEAEPEIIQCDVDLSKLSEQDFINNKKKLDSKHKAYYVPIILGEHHLGYMILVTKGYTLPIFYSILEDFENYYIDDQILHFAK